MYIRTKDMPIWERAERRAVQRGMSFSEYVTATLRAAFAQPVGHGPDPAPLTGTRVVVDVDTDTGTAVRQAFAGEWLITPYTNTQGDMWGVALTAKCRLAVWSHLKRTDRRALRVYETIDHAFQGARLSGGAPPTLLHQVKAILDDQRVEELDI